MTQTKQAKSRKKPLKKNPLADLMNKSLDSYNNKQPQTLPKASQRHETSQEEESPALQKQPLKKPSAALKSKFTKRRTGIQLSERDIEITRKITATLAEQGADGVNTSRLLKIGLLLCERADEVTLLSCFEEVLADDGRMRKEGE